MLMKTDKNFGIYQQQRQSGGGDNGRQKTQQPLRHHHEGEGKHHQQIQREAEKAEMAEPAGERVQPARQRAGPVRNKQIATAKPQAEQDIEKGEPVTPTDHLGYFVTVALTICHHSSVLACA